MLELFGNALSQTNFFLTHAELEGKVVVDATAGNGKDTLFLAQSVGSQGKVYAFDIQEAAVIATTSLLQNEGISWCRVIQDSHENIDLYPIGSPHAVVFNLGYLPGGDHTFVTKAEVTLRAVHKALHILAVDGILTITVYPGHPGGDQEAKDLSECISRLPRNFDVLQLTFPNRGNNPPYLIAIRKLKEL